MYMLPMLSTCRCISLTWRSCGSLCRTVRTTFELRGSFHFSVSNQVRPQSRVPKHETTTFRSSHSVEVLFPLISFHYLIQDIGGPLVRRFLRAIWQNETNSLTDLLSRQGTGTCGCARPRTSRSSCRRSSSSRACRTSWRRRCSARASTRRCARTRSPSGRSEPSSHPSLKKR